MKKLMVIVGFILLTMPALAQPANLIYLPVTDMGLMPQRIAAAALYGSISVAENSLKSSVRSYAKTYNKRALYYAGAIVITKINGSINKSEERLKELIKSNAELDEKKFYSKRIPNNKLLKGLEESLYILKQEMLKQHKLVIYGEKLNLLQNTMRTLTEINRRLDIVENNISDSADKKHIIKELKSYN
ncbi:hypothetical protein [Fulvivirga sediminis]|uniref:DUF4142 domain-containing protein n=1 Tax=Fulvivirga sediminis TaxID=2803949 RepID=A0A937FC03_9BACT|nr:hypothetical protein [Fulvivirga sediminis]MBL3658409.1 hypothetical protein [Fulvivirga sediminis]